jgi:membrane protease YdiL (CAAX protease family)
MSLVSNSRPQLRAVGVSVGVGLLGIVLAAVFVFVGAGALYLLQGEPSVLLLLAISLLLGQGVAFMGTAYAYLRWRGLPLQSVGIRVPSLKELAIGAGVFVVTILYLMGAGFLMQQTGTEGASNNVATLAMENPEIILLLLPGAYLLIGPGEELLFRGVVQGRLRESFSAVPAILIASVIFASIHVFSLQAGAPLSAKLVTITLLMGPSIAFGAVYEYTENIVIPALLHGTYDAFLFIALYVVASGGMEAPESGSAVAAVLATLPF